MRGIRWVVAAERVEDRSERVYSPKTNPRRKLPVQQYRLTNGNHVAPRMVYRMKAVDTTKYTEEKLRELRKTKGVGNVRHVKTTQGQNQGLVEKEG